MRHFSPRVFVFHLLDAPRVARWLFVAGTLYTAGVLAWLGYRWGGTGTVALVANVATVPLWAAATIVSGWQARRVPAGLTRLAWLLVMLAFAAYAAGEATWLVYEEVLHQEPFPSWADLGYLAFYPLLAAGLFRFPPSRRRMIAQRDYWLDGLMVLLGGGIALWLFVIAPVVQANKDGTAALLLSIAYPVGDLALLLGATNVLLRGLPHARRAALLLGIVAFIIADAGFTRLELADRYASGDWPDAAWVLAAWLMLVAATPQQVQPDTQAGAAPTATGARSFSPLAYSALALGLLMLVVLAVQLRGEPAAGLVTAAVALTALGMARQVTVFRDNNRLNQRSIALLQQIGHREARFRALVQHATDVILVSDAAGMVRYITPSAATVLGREREDCLDQPVDGFLHPDSVRATERALLQLPPEGGTVTLPARVLHASGAWREVDLTAVNLTTEPGVEGVVITLHDVTDARLAARALQEAHDELEQRVLVRTVELSNANALLEEEIAERRRAEAEAAAASRAKSEYLSRMSHELRTPLNAILGFAQLMEMDERTEEDTENIRMILDAGKHLLSMINEVLDISRIESGRLQLESQPVPLAEVAGEAEAMVGPLAVQRDIRIVNRLGERATSVLADHQRLRQVLLNLLSNAIKYNYPGGTVTITEAEDPRRPAFARLCITDTGPGLTAEQRTRLFTPFERLDADRSGVEGTGLGLALSYRLAEAMGGILGVTSAPGEGSTFWVDLPRSEDAPAALAVPAAFEPASLPPPVACTVLYIEDNPVNIKLMQAIVAMRPGVTLLAALTGSEGLDLARRCRPALLLLDRQLPDISGEQVLAELKAGPTTAAIPVVVVSADASPQQIDTLLAAGARAYLTKPLAVQDVLAQIDAAGSGPACAA